MVRNFKGKSLDEVYKLRKDFCIIGLTGRTASGVTEFAQILEGDFNSLKLPNLESSEIKNNNGRKYRICYNYLKENWEPFKIISYKDIITLIILLNNYDELINFLREWIFEAEDFITSNGKKIENNLFSNNNDEIIEIDKLRNIFDILSKELLEIWSILDGEELQVALWTIFDSQKYKSFSTSLHNSLKLKCPAKRIKILQTISNSYRRCGSPYCQNPDNKLENVFKIVEILNLLILGYSKRESNNSTNIIIDSFRNPLEIMYMKERYSAFYMFAISRNEDERAKIIKDRYDGDNCELIKEIDIEEYESQRGEFNKQDVGSCIQKSDVHINNNALNTEDFIESNQEEIFLPTKCQILRFISLIYHPGLITPSPEERCMQIAFTAKYNSGCISRQVGAVVTDENFSIKSIGWNDTAQNQVPCLLRNADDLLGELDSSAYSEYEKSSVFKSHLDGLFSRIDKNHIKGKNCSFCFKDMQNFIEKEKNQVHTRSLHAEENAFLQITKYGGMSISKGILFTTASPCELCSKKAYQLGIKKIYYIDPYPGIAREQILQGGSQNPNLTLFYGAIGQAYHKLYEPFLPYKDELLILSGLKIPNYKKDLESDNEKLKRENKRLRDHLNITVTSLQKEMAKNSSSLNPSNPK